LCDVARRPRSGGVGAEQRGYPAATAPQLGRHPRGEVLGLQKRGGIVRRVNVDGVAEAVSAHEIKSIIHFGPPGPVTLRPVTTPAG
jgi:hypothetical protein